MVAEETLDPVYYHGNRGAVSLGKASRSCCTTQDDVGCAVTPKWMISRRPWPMTNHAYNNRNRTVGTTRKSIAAMPCL